MAINLDEKYPGRAQPKSVRYPQGAFKNRTAPDSQDGTYLEQDWANDMSGFLQWLLANAGITANGQVDNALASQYAEALIKVIESQAASETKSGTAMIALQTEVDNGVNDSKIVTSKKLRWGFRASFASNGYVIFPTWLGGLAIQWGNGNTSSSGQRINLPTPFPNNFFACVVNDVGPTCNSQGTEITDKAFFTLYSRNVQTGEATSSAYRYIAIGN